MESAHAGIKRKHSPNVEEPRPSAPAITPINYLAAPKMERLRLIEGDSETFSDVLDMIDVYEGMSLFHVAKIRARHFGFLYTFQSSRGILGCSRAGKRTCIWATHVLESLRGSGSLTC